MRAESTLPSPASRALLGGEPEILELIATGAPLETVLDELCRVIDDQSGLRSSIFLLDDAAVRLRLAAGPRLPDGWRQKVASFPVTVTACGAAVTRREQIISADIASDPLYEGFYDAAKEADIRAVWSTPFISKNGLPFGTFAVYSDVPGSPSVSNLALVGRATHLASIAVERHLTEQRLRESEIRFSRTFYANPACMVIWSFSDGRFLYVNDAFVRMFGYSREESIGQSAISLGLYADSTQRPQMIQRLLQGGLHEIEIQGRTKSGDILNLIVSMERIELCGEQSVLATAIDITERKRAEEKLRSSERLLSLAQSVAHIGNWTWDVRKRVVTWSDEVYRLFGVQRGDIDPRTEAMGFVHPDDRDVIMNAIQRTFETKEPYSFFYRIQRRDGEQRILHSRGYVVNDEHGEPVSIFGTTQDVTDQRRAEEALQTLTTRVMHAQDDERRRVAQLLHETTAQDLAGLKMLLARLNRTSDRLSDADRALIAESVQLADHSMTDIRTLAYLLHPPFLDEAGLLSALRWYAQGFADRSGIQVDLDLPDALERLPQDVETALFRVAQEALINIHRHADSPTARIRLRVAADRLVLEVEDHGRGMAQDFVAQVIAGVRPLGVGLAGMRERLKQIRGVLEIESSQNGTIVRASLPVSSTAS